MKVRVLFDDGRHAPSSIVHDGLNKDQALSLFAYYVDCALKLNMTHIRVVNLFVGKKCVKMLQNH